MGHVDSVRITSLLVAASLVAASAAAQEVGYNDLTEVGANPLKYTKFIPDSSCNGGSGGGLGVGIGCPPATYPLELLLLHVDRGELPMEGEAIALLRLRNVGHDSVLIPWFTDPDEIELPDENGKFKFFDADLRENLFQEGSSKSYVLPVQLYGAKEVPGSLQEIRPGEYVELKVKLALDCRDERPNCDGLKAGPARLSLTWTEWDASETYEKCGIQSKRSRVRELTSDAAVMTISAKVASRWIRATGKVAKITLRFTSASDEFS